MSEPVWSRIVLHLARTREFPQGSARHGYAFVAPLDAQDHIDVDAWRENPERCVVERFWGAEPPVQGRLVRRPGGPEGASWGFDYDARTHSDDEAGFRFGSHAFREGEYVSVRDPDDEMHTFRIASVEPA